MRYHLLQKFFEKVVKIKDASFFLSKCLVSIGQHCICIKNITNLKNSRFNHVFQIGQKILISLNLKLYLLLQIFFHPSHHFTSFTAFRRGVKTWGLL